MKIVVYAICKNEEKFVDRWVKSMSEADEIYVSDTGSSDSTIEKLKSYGVIVNSIKVEPWRFDTARNMSLEFVPDDADICVCTDLDEIFEKGWRKVLESKWSHKTTRAKYNYIWSFKDDGSPDTSFWIEKIHARHGFKWIHPVHEVLEYNGDKKDTYAICDKILLKHYPDRSKSRCQYLPLLEMSVKECPDDDRNMHYLGREYMYYQQYEKCIDTLKKHLSMPSAVWQDERCASMRYIARSYDMLGNKDNAEKWYYKAIIEAPYLREPYIEAGRLAYKNEKWEKAYFLITQGLRITEKPSTYINEGFCWDSTPYDMLSIICYNIKYYNKALEYANMAYSMNPCDRIKNNIEIIKGGI